MLTINGNVTIHRDTNNVVYIYVKGSKRNDDNTYQDVYEKIYLNFLSKTEEQKAKNDSLKNKSKIELKNAWLSFTRMNIDGENVKDLQKLVVAEYEVLEEGIDELELTYKERMERKQEYSKTQKETEWGTYSNDELPF
jgi:hypothetical protein